MGLRDLSDCDRKSALFSQVQRVRLGSLVTLERRLAVFVPLDVRLGDVLWHAHRMTHDGIRTMKGSPLELLCANFRDP